MPIRLVVGLGNPGERYERTRHNVGFMLLDRVEPDEPWRRWKDLGVVGRKTAEGAEFFCAKPSTYMNESGRMVRDFAGFHKIAPAEILVCFDEVALPLGSLRIRTKGSAGGQKGMQSVLDHLGTQEVPRLRLGVGPQPPGRDSKDFVLSGFAKAEAEALDRVLNRAREAVLAAVVRGVEPAMNAFNAPEPA